jgi:hypothetical protein
MTTTAVDEDAEYCPDSGEDKESIVKKKKKRFFNRGVDHNQT